MTRRGAGDVAQALRPSDWPNQAARAAVIVLALMAAVAAAYAARSFLAPTFVALVLAVMLSPISAALERAGAPAPAAAALTIGPPLLALILALVWLAPLSAEWLNKAPAMVAELEREFQGVRESLQAVREAAEQVEEAANLGGEDRDTVVLADGGLMSNLAVGAPAAVASCIYAVILMFFMLAERRRLRLAVLKLPLSSRMRSCLGQAMIDMGSDVAHYLLITAIINLVLGALSGIVLHAFGVPNAPLWGAGVALLNFIPYVGPVVMQAVIFIVCVTTQDSLSAAIWPTLSVIALNQIEGQVVTPLILGSRLQLSPLAVFLAVGFGGWLWGIAGAFVAAPLLVMCRTLAANLLRKKPAPPSISLSSTMPAPSRALV
jgi:predicted PurR-regulated permease PerM